MKTKYIVFSFGMLICCYADSERQNCRENLSLIDDEKNFALILSLTEPNSSSSGPKINQKDKELFAGYYIYLNEKSIARKKKCDGDLILKIFSPEAKDFK